MTKTSMNYGKKMNFYVKRCETMKTNQDVIPNLRVDGLKKIENETWEQTEGILQQMIREVLELEGIFKNT